MSRKPRQNVLRVKITTTEVWDATAFGERVLVMPTSVTGWWIALGEADGARLYAILQAFLPEALLSDDGPSA